MSNSLALSVGWHHTYIILAVGVLVSGATWCAAAYMWQRGPADLHEEEQAAKVGQVQTRTLRLSFKPISALCPYGVIHFQRYVMILGSSTGKLLESTAYMHHDDKGRI